MLLVAFAASIRLLSEQKRNLPAALAFARHSYSISPTGSVYRRLKPSFNFATGSLERSTCWRWTTKAALGYIHKMATLAHDIDGKSIASTIRAEVKSGVEALMAESGKVPGLAVILVGNRTDSATYVRMKRKACEECGISSFGYQFPSTVSQEDLLATIKELNERADVHGILIQLPLPEHIDENAVLNSVKRSKDVDGLTALNMASLCSTATHLGNTRINWEDFSMVPFHVACTPQGCIELLNRSGVEIRGKNAVVIGRSNLVGLPTAMLLMHRDATVTIVHSKTVNAPDIVSKADIVVAAVGRAEMVRAEWLKPGCVVIDVGINSVSDPSSNKGYRLVGDVDYEAARMVAGMITPVPGGVGPMTIAMLLRNTLNSCRRA